MKRRRGHALLRRYIVDVRFTGLFMKSLERMIRVVSSDNFVDIVGYQLERVHTGVIKWILDSRNPRFTAERYRILGNLYRRAGRNVPFREDEIKQITCTPEFSFGRRLKIDLVVKVETVSGRRHFLVMEMKVDSIPGSEQLKETLTKFESSSEKGEEDTAEYFLLLFGASQVCTGALNPNGFTLLGTEDIIDCFAGVEPRHAIAAQWLEALEAELNRQRNVA